MLRSVNPRLFALRAVRGREDHGLLPWNAVDTDVCKASEYQSETENKDAVEYVCDVHLFSSPETATSDMFTMFT